MLDKRGPHMNGKTTRIAFALALASLAFHGCDKNETKKGNLAALEGKSGFAIMPKDANAVGGLNLVKVVSSNVWKVYGTMAMYLAASELEQFKKTCSMDPMQAIESVILGGNLESQDGVVVIKGVERKDAVSCAQKLAESRGEKITVTEEGTITTAVDSTGSPVHFGWLDDKTLVVAPRQARDKGKVEAIMGGGGGLDGNKEIMDLLGNVDTTAALWGVARNTTGRAMGPITATAAYGSVSLDGGIKVDMGIRQENGDKAKSVADQLKQAVKPFKGTPLEKFAAKVKIKTNEADVIVQLSLTDNEIAELAQTAQKNPEVANLVQRLMQR